MRFKAVSFPGWPKLPSAYPPVGLIRPGGAVDSMTARRLTISEETYKALQAEGLVTGESPGAVLERLVSGGISQKAREVLNAIGETTAKAIKPKSGKGQLARNTEALEEIKRLWSEGERDRKVISTKIGYPYSTTGDHIRKMLESGELQEVEDEGEES